MEHQQVVVERLARLETEYKNLMRCHQEQNGRIEKLSRKIDQIYYWIIMLLGMTLLSVILQLYNRG